MRNCIPVLMFVSANAIAGSTVYKCSTPTGTVFLDHPCDNVAQTQSANSYYAPPPSCGDKCNGEYVRPNAEPVASEQQQEPQTFDSVATTRTNAGIAQGAFKCTDDRKTWIQSSPCPPSTRRLEISNVELRSMNTGMPIAQGTMYTPGGTSVPVQQDTMERAEVCDQIKQTTAVGGRGKDSGYARNQIRAANDCTPMRNKSGTFRGGKP